MSKKILAVVIILVLIMAGGQSAFWFFKTSQLEKHLTKYLNKKDTFFSVDKFEISGFPLQQNVSAHILKIKVPESFVKSSNLIFKKIKLSSSIFSNNFDINILENTVLRDANSRNNKVEFNKNPTASLKINSSGIESFTYRDNGYVIFGEDKNPITKSGANSVQLTVSKNESGQIISHIKASSKDAENFDLAEFYKNNYENSIIDGIKTGKIQIGMKELEQNQEIAENEILPNKYNEEFSPEKLNENFKKQIAKINKEVAIAKNDNASNDKVTNTVINTVAASTKEIQEDTAASLDNTNTVDSLAKKSIDKVSEEITAGDIVPTEDAAALQIANQKEKLDHLIEKELADLEIQKDEKEIVKNDVIIDIECIKTPIESNSQKASDPTKIAQIVTNYDKSYKINQFKISNDNFKININGQLNQPRDDTNMSGFITLKIDMATNFIDFVKSSFEKIASENDTKIQSFDQSYNSAIVKNAYSSFLSVVSDRLEEITREIAAKNQLSQNEKIVLEIRREKNLDIVINETPIREIVGKF